MTENNASVDPKELLLDRLYAEMKSTNVNSDEFRAAFRYAAELREEKTEAQRKLEFDISLQKLSREAAETQQRLAETARIEKETAAPNEKKSFFDKHGDAIIGAAAGVVGVVLVVSAESLGNKILNSKALKMPTIQF